MSATAGGVVAAISPQEDRIPMRSKFLVVLVVLALLLPAVIAGAQAQAELRSSTVAGPTVVRMQPDAQDTLRGQGKQPRNPFPNSVNRGKKFNPTGDVIQPLPADATQNILVLFADFTDAPPGGPATALSLDKYFDPLLLGTTYDPPEYAKFGKGNYPTDRTLKNYYYDVSYGKVTVGSLNKPSDLGWLSTGHPYNYYVHDDNGFGAWPGNAQGLVRDAVMLADAKGVDFSQYSVNGVVPNLFVVFRGTGAEWSGAWNLIWSHSWSISDGNTEYPNGLTVDGVTIDNYAMMPEVGGDLTGYLGTVTGPYPPTVGVFAHEYGHVLGLPDFYDYGYESEGVGMYSLMAGGSWNRYPNDPMFSGNSPAQIDAWGKWYLGFVTPKEITDTSNVTLRPAETSPDIYKMVVPNSGGKEYYLFENRQQIDWDLGFSRRGKGVHGLAIYHVDDTVLTRTFWRPNEAENWKEFRSEGWRPAPNGETHYGVSIIQADDQWDLEHGIYWTGYEGDLYPGAKGVTRFGSNTAPNSSTYYFWSGSAPKFGYSGVTVDNITEKNGDVSATFSFQPWKPGK